MKSNLKSTKHLRVWLLAGYGILLAISHLVRQNTPAEAPLAQDKQLTRLPAVDGERSTKQEIKLAYREFVPAAKKSLPVLILLHGSPKGSETFDDLGPALGKNHRVIVPDLPGFGASSAFIPDYSIRAHAKYVLRLMNHRDVKKAHLVGYSMGGGVAINMAEIAPEKISSLFMTPISGPCENICGIIMARC